MFTLANSIAVSMYLIGFCESVVDMLAQFLPDFNGIVDSEHRVNDIRLIGSVSLVLILGLAIMLTNPDDNDSATPETSEVESQNTEEAEVTSDSGEDSPARDNSE